MAGKMGSIVKNEVSPELARLVQVAPEIQAMALRRIGKYVRKAARADVPIDLGLLQKGILYRVDRDVVKIKASSMAGGAPFEYALLVHENLKAVHAVGEAKYLEKPFAEAVHDGKLLEIARDAVIAGMDKKYGFHFDIDNPDEGLTTAVKQVTRARRGAGKTANRNGTRRRK